MVGSEELGSGLAALVEEPSNAQVVRARRATYAAFAGSGFAFANWASRIPQVRDHFHLKPSSLGLVIFALAVGSIMALPLSGIAISRAGAARAVAVMSVLLGIGTALVAIGYTTGIPLVVTGLFLFGFGNGAWDVAMNVHAGALERRLGRSIMPRFHAGWSVGTVAGAGVGALAVALRVPVTAHLMVVAALVVLVIPAATKNFLPEARSSHSGDAPATGQAAPKRSHARAALSAWLEPRTLATGAFVLAFAFAEGAANDWTSVAAIDGYHFSPTLGTLTLATFLASMTTGRWFSPLLLDRYGRVPVAQCLALLATAGVILFVFGPGAPFAFIGAVLWGLGTSVGFPLGMSAGGDDPDRAPARVSVIASIGYCAFLGGPPLVGFLGNHFTVRHGLIAVGALLVIALLLAPALRPPARALASPAGAQEVEQPAL